MITAPTKLNLTTAKRNPDHATGSSVNGGPVELVDVAHRARTSMSPDHLLLEAPSNQKRKSLQTYQRDRPEFEVHKQISILTDSPKPGLEQK